MSVLAVLIQYGASLNARCSQGFPVVSYVVMDNHGTAHRSDFRMKTFFL
ncbi:hypothetical protein [Paraburkholderia bannensis]|nr:hypothetical protein [Paraburkholderia bannensis]